MWKYINEFIGQTQIKSKKKIDEPNGPKGIVHTCSDITTVFNYFFFEC